jgi:hypothetical protein
MSQIVDALPKGSVQIDFFELKNLDGGILDLIPFVTEFNIYESIFEPFITATAAFDDSRGVVDLYVLNGSEVSIRYRSYKDSDPVTMKFIVDSANAILPDSMGRSQTYFLNLISVDTMRAIAVRVDENYVNLAPEDMIKNILKDKIKTNKNFYFSKTNSTDSINCSSLYPFQAIDAIKKRAVSRGHNSSTYVFFENQYGYCFKTIEEVLSDAAKDPQITNGDRNFYFDINEPNDITKSAWRKIETLQKITQQSLTQQILYGGVRSNIFAYNINTGEHYKFEYHEDNDANKFKGMSPKRKMYSKVYSDEIYKKGDKLSNLMVAPVLDENGLLRIQKEILSKAFSVKISNVLRIEIAGDSRLTVGTAANLDIPVIGPATSTRTNEISSGIYMFSGIRHTFKPADAATGRGYRQYCEMINTGVS